ncbi:hypothetical protein HJB51_26260 [Rhizobium lentis]|uniref:hypothetical protein n=1 Tax=Rhizobium lentis TaxID=1138194 RepID=UPI001A92236F|nr:hypothetical protein [Rhizobium lentis]MBX5043461.1 hypothetical protein [Rhizobium lentis]MBX5056217.1 hypothetical protein [Rhizobium lentis]MBX5066387.1 hypothetical protein [Rhizobium lentis]MBX5074170.1 hypothetical protein [Rhizobium lentis]MBX5077455.1 hypothetical protein [Rhizobium lentis]
MANASFAAALRESALDLLAIHHRAPRIVRYVADLQKWLLSQAALALHFERKLDPSCPALTAANLGKFLDENHIASHNTAVSHLKEMAHYKLLEPAQTTDRRANPLQASAYAESLIRQWFEGHLRSLDGMDAGDRYRRSQEDETILYRAQPRIARRLFNDPDWYSPPDSIALFARSESGSNILHDLMSRVPLAPVLGERTWVGDVSARLIAVEYVISRSHAGRLLAAAQNQGLLGWEASQMSGECWISAKFVLDYRRWQATKFSVVSEVFASIQ